MKHRTQDTEKAKKTGKNLFHVPCSMLREKGFTLIELLTVLAIISLISGIFVLNYREGERNLALQRSGQVLTQGIRRAINSSLGGKQHDGTVSEGGYGIFLEEGSSTITVFADCDIDGVMDTAGVASSCRNAPAEAEAYPEISFEQELEGDAVVKTLSPNTGGELYIVFVPPDPTVTFNPGLPGDEALIVIEDARGNSLTVFVNKLGITRIE